MNKIKQTINEILNGSEYRLHEEELYKQVSEEIEDGFKKKGLWIKALVDSGNNEKEAKPLYVKYRVQSVLDEESLKESLEAKAGMKSDALNFLKFLGVIIMFAVLVNLFYIL